MECGYKHRMLRSTEQMQAMMVSGDGKWSVLTSTGSSYALRDGRARREVITQPSHSELKSLIEIEAYIFV